MTPGQSHYKNLERLLFASDGASVPGWLQDSVRGCQQRYAGIDLTEQFKAAVNSFDDGGVPKPFELFVVGEGKFGKSTLVNCLLGEEQSKVRGLPETRCFLRYVVTDSPSDRARLFLRAQKGLHDWILSKAGKGRHVKELYEILEHSVDLRTARELLSGELERLDRGGYEPAIYEIERDIHRSRQTAFTNPIRVVDTQGLDQLFPAELQRSTQGLSDDTTAERFIKWMNSSPRGKHLEWQFRRCDAVLWCVNAKRIGSASTVASLRYFSGYAKKIIIALTNVDIAKNDGERLRLVEAAAKKYSEYSNRIIPVNGLAAWNGICEDDTQKVEESGFKNLVQVLTDVCEVEGYKVRNMSRYSGLRHTESQYRLVLRTLASDYIELQKKYESDKVRVAKSLERDWDTVCDAIVRTANSLARDVSNRLTSIEYRDDRSTVDRKLGHQMEVARLSSFIREQIDKRVLPNVATQTQLTTAYRLPAFDADGNRAGSTFAISPEPRAAAISIDLPYFCFQLGDWFDNAVDWMDEKFGRLVGGKGASDQRRAQRLQERWEHIAEVFSSEWRRHVGTSLEQVKQETIRQYQTLHDAIESVFGRIEHHAGGSVSEALGRIRGALEDIAVPPVFQAQMLSSLSGMQSGKLKNCGRRSVATLAGSVERGPARSAQRPRSGTGKAPVETDLRHSISSTSFHGPSNQRHWSVVLSIGARLIHKKLGPGKILDMDWNYCLVQFDSEAKPRKFSQSTLLDPEWFSRDS
ncbi:MAG: hypothetical protein KAX55_01965 [Propionivibrio sp.]|nr:hypothetical protein [Propionivibrio sp.]